LRPRNIILIDAQLSTRLSRYTVGLTAPIGTSFALDYSEITYRDTSDPDLTDQSNLDFSGAIDFRIDPRITAQLTAKYIDFDAQGDGVNRKTTGVGAGVILDITQTLRANIGLSFDKIERTGDETGTNEGVSFDSQLIQTLSNGTIGATLRSDVTSNLDGRRNFFSIDREMDLPRGQTLGFSLGGTNSETSTFDPLVDIRYGYALPAAQLTFSLSQVFDTDSDNQERINTTLRANYRQDINSVSGFNIGVALFDRNELGFFADDGRRADFDMSYNHAVTRDWDIVAGYRYTFSASDSGPDRSRNTIFLGLERAFSWSP